MKVSIIIPTFNRKDMLREAVLSAVQQGIVDCEIIVTDNASDDGTDIIMDKLIIEHPSIIYLRSEENLGPVKNWNRGIAHSKGQYICLLFSDDAWSLGYLKRLLSVLDDDKNCGFAFASQRNYDEKDRVHVHRPTTIEKIPANQFIIKKTFGLRPLPHSPGCAMFRSEYKDTLFLETITNRFGLDFNRYGAGVDLISFFYALKGYKYAACVKDECAYFRGHKGSFSSSLRLRCYYDYAKYYYMYSSKRYLYAGVLFVAFIFRNVIKRGHILNWKKVGQSIERKSF